MRVSSTGWWARTRFAPFDQVEFGGREIVGLYRASRHYFRKEPKDLNPDQGALLAGMVQAPARFKSAERETVNRADMMRSWFELMAEQGRITETEHRRAVQVGSRPVCCRNQQLDPGLHGMGGPDLGRRVGADRRDDL